MTTTHRHQPLCRVPLPRLWRLCLLLVFWGWGAGALAAAPVVVVKEGEQIPLAGSLDVLADDIAVEPDRLLAGDYDSQFHRYDVVSIPFLAQPVWLRVRVANATARQRLVLSTGDVLFTEARLLYNRAADSDPPDPVNINAGLAHQRIWQDWHYYDIGFPLIIPPDQMRTVYLKLHSPFPLLVSPFVADEMAYGEKMIRKSSWGHLMVGLMMGVLLYLIVMAFMMRDLDEAYYCTAFVAVSFAVLLCSRGYLLRIIPPGEWLHSHLYPLLLSAQAFTYIAFSRQHFKTQLDFPTTDLLLRLSLTVTAAVFFLSLVLPAAWGALVVNVLAFGLVALMCIASVYIWANSSRHLTVYTLGSMVFLFSAILAAAENGGFINLGALSRSGFEAGICIQAMLFAAALAEKIGEFRETEQQAALRIAETQAENRAKSSFLAKMSHELRTPMNGLLGMVQLLERTPLNDQQQHYIEVMRNSGRMLLSVIDDVLDYSRIVAGQLRLEDSDFSLVDTLNDIETLFTPAARQKGLTLRLSINTDNPTLVRGDGQRLRQVLANLVSNAVKFTERGNVTLRVWVELRNNEQWLLHCEVEDTGIGMNEEQVGQLFRQIAHTNGTKNYGGSGLGLVICKQLVEMMGGGIHVESAPGYGSLFRFHIAVRPPSSDRAAHPSTASRRQAHILVAEDDATNAEVILGMLAQLGHRAECVDNGRKAVASFCEPGQHWDLVLMDVEMPQLDGLAATQRIRQWEAAHYANAVPVVALTAHAVRSQEERILQAGMDDILGKPVDMQQLQNALERWLPHEPVPKPNTLPDTLSSPLPPT